LSTTVAVELFPVDEARPGAPRLLARPGQRRVAGNNDGAFAQKAEGGATRLDRAGHGSAARFFYSAKADVDDRLGSGHPTVKPLDLMRWLVRLVTPLGGRVLDPFAGTRTTGHAALLEGFRAVLIEREEAYRADIARRLGHAFAYDRERRQMIAKAKRKVKPPGALFELDGAAP
jgi:site-specific DNA-methyltransferase (adenine-specific)